jgi:hypothetical protein
MPPYNLPKQRTFSGVIHRSHHGVAANASEICFQNHLGSELLRVHAETDSLQQAENNHVMQVGKVHRHEVGQFFHTIVGKPVDVNQTAVGIGAGASGSGTGGGMPRPEDEPIAQAFDEMPLGAIGSGLGGSGGGGIGPAFPGQRTDVYGNNVTNIYGDDTYLCTQTARVEIRRDNHTYVQGVDYYHAINQMSLVNVSSLSAVLGTAISYETSVVDVVAAAKLEFSSIIHVDFAVSKVDGSLVGTEGVSLKMFTFG